MSEKGQRSANYLFNIKKKIKIESNLSLMLELHMSEKGKVQKII